MSRRQKRHYLLQPAPRILHLPVRPSRRIPRAVKVEAGGGSGKEKLGTLFERERRFRKSGEGRVEMVDAGEGDKAWMFQEEVMRAECNVLRMEKEIAVKKLRSSRLSTEKILRSAIQALIEGKKRIAAGMNVELVIDKEIENLVGKLGELRRKTRVKKSEGGRSCSNFDIQVAVLQRRLEKLGGVGISENLKKDIIHIQCEGDDEDCGNCKVELLRRKMERLSKDLLLERMIEEYGSMFSTSKRIEWHPPQSVLAMSELDQNVVSGMENACSGHCKAVVRRIIEQVRSETEHWSQIQVILGQVRDEMEELQASRDFWEDRALDNDRGILSLSSAAREWRQKAMLTETKLNELQVHIAELQEEVERQRMDEDECRRGISREVQGETEKQVLICHLRENRRLMETELRLKENSIERRRKVQGERQRKDEVSREVQGETEKQVLICHLRENRWFMETEHRLKENSIERRRKVHASDADVAGSSRFPFKDIGNLSSRKNG